VAIIYGAMTAKNIEHGQGAVTCTFAKEGAVDSSNLPKLDRAALRARLLAEFERTVESVADAVDNAPSGRVIRDSEEPARLALDRLRCVVYEAALQAKVDAAEAAFPPSAQCDQRKASASQGPATV
jgi:hypothetical protein